MIQFYTKLEQLQYFFLTLSTVYLVIFSKQSYQIYICQVSVNLFLFLPVSTGVCLLVFYLLRLKNKNQITQELVKINNSFLEKNKLSNDQVKYMCRLIYEEKRRLALLVILGYLVSIDSFLVGISQVTFATAIPGFVFMATLFLVSFIFQKKVLILLRIQKNIFQKKYLS